MTLTITDSAASQIASIITEQGKAGQALRIVVGGGGCGCNGPSFGMGFDAEQDGDTVLDISGVRVVIDADTAPQLEGASIDYVDDVMQQGFSIEAPNAQQAGGSCGCGSA